VICTNFGSAQVATGTTSACIALPDALGHGAQTTGSNKKMVEQQRESVHLPFLERMAVAAKVGLALGVDHEGD
jgi:hypothetical protein